MLFLTIVLLLAAVLDPSLGQEEMDEEEEDDDTDDDLPESGLTLETQKIILDAHNAVRRKVKPTAANMLKMVWNETVGKNAHKWAEQCILANSPEDSRKLGQMPCGETMFQSNKVTRWQDVINFWLTGKEHFKYGVGAVDPRKNIFAYTQLVWYNSYIIGCAVAHCSTLTFPFVYICHYCPGGNLMTQVPKPYKEGPPCKDCPDNCENKLCTNPCKYMDIILNCKDVKKIFTCKNKMVASGCQATCRCKKEIV